MSNENMQHKANRLASEKNPYLLQHAYNPVDWYPWGEEAFAKAKAEDKPIFLSIGYSYMVNLTCHWCHIYKSNYLYQLVTLLKIISYCLIKHYVRIHLGWAFPINSHLFQQ